MILDQAGLEEGAGQPRDHAVDAREVAQRAALVLDAVLRADDRRLDVAGGGLEVEQCALGVLGLHREDDDVVVGPLELAGVADSLDRQLDGAEVVGDEAESALLNGAEVVAAADQDGVEAAVEEAPADGRADAAGAVDDGSARCGSFLLGGC